MSSERYTGPRTRAPPHVPLRLRARATSGEDIASCLAPGRVRRSQGRVLPGSGVAGVGGSAVLDLVHDRRVGERGRVAERALLGHVAEETPHDLAAPRLRQLRREDDVGRLGDRADLARDVVAQLLELLDRALGAA